MRRRPRLSTLLAALLALAPAARAAPVDGRIAAPGGTLPALTVYAWSLRNAKLYSLSTAEGQASFTIDLPRGRYYLFAAPLEPGAPAIYGAYTRFAACAGTAAGADCSRHDLKTLVVGRRALPEVELTDWYLDDAVTRRLDRMLGRPGGAGGEDELAAPRFSEYPAPASSARAAALATADEPRIEHDRELLTAALSASANFAGRAVLVRVGCGGHCESAALVDLPSGRVAYPAELASLPAATRCVPGGALKFRRDSRLLTLTAISGGERLTHYFLWDGEGGTLKPLASLSSVVAGHCAAGR
jgi:hypothetical protein